ncbi:MAG: flavin reductase [Chloroflexi bacterium]|nr:flavin reductase [Chloroflexota bacterium]
MPVSADVFRRVLGSFASGVTIVTSRVGDTVHGTTMSAFCSVSLDPPLVLICVDKKADSHDFIARGGVFAVNILPQSQADLATTLARKGTPPLEAAHRLEGIPYRTGATGAPILGAAMAYADCQVVQAVEAGDHTVYVGRIEDGDTPQSEAEPLLFYRGKYGRFAPQ